MKSRIFWFYERVGWVFSSDVESVKRSSLSDVRVGFAADDFGCFAESLFVALAFDVEHQAFAGQDAQVDHRKYAVRRADFFARRDCYRAVRILSDFDQMCTFAETDNAFGNQDEGNFVVRRNFRFDVDDLAIFI